MKTGYFISNLPRSGVARWVPVHTDGTGSWINVLFSSSSVTGSCWRVAADKTSFAVKIGMATKF